MRERLLCQCRLGIVLSKEKSYFPLHALLASRFCIPPTPG